MKQIELIGLLIKYKTNLKALKEQLSPTFWDLFKQAVNNNDVKRANFYWRFDKLVQKGKMTDRYLPKGHDDDPVAQMFKAIYKKGE